MDKQPEEVQTLRLPRGYRGFPQFLPEFSGRIAGAWKGVECGIIIEPAAGRDGHTLKLHVWRPAENDEMMWEDFHEFDFCVNKEMFPFGGRPIDVMSFITHHEGGLDNLGTLMFEYLIECCVREEWEEADFIVSKEEVGNEEKLVFTLTLHGEEPYIGQVVLPWGDFANKYFITR